MKTNCYPDLFTYTFPESSKKASVVLSLLKYSLSSPQAEQLMFLSIFTLLGKQHSYLP